MLVLISDCFSASLFSFSFLYQVNAPEHRVLYWCCSQFWIKSLSTFMCREHRASRPIFNTLQTAYSLIFRIVIPTISLLHFFTVFVLRRRSCLNFTTVLFMKMKMCPFPCAKEKRRTSGTKIINHRVRWWWYICIFSMEYCIQCTSNLLYRE